MEQKRDLRLIKTDLNIKSSFVKLLNEKDFESITVQNILNKALINRTTFYKHYMDKFELAAVIAKEFLEEFKSFADVRLANKEDAQGLLKGMDIVYEKFYEQKMTILGLWKIHIDKIHVYEDMQTILKEKYIEFAKNYTRENANIEYQAYIFASLLLSTLKFILESQKVYTAHELIAELVDFQNIISSVSIKR